MSYYSKYRPQKTTDLDIVAVRDFYANLLKSGKFSHAYLFSGPRGTGKTSSARILAKLINCEQNREAVQKGLPLVEPCGECATCKRIVAGSSLAVMEMDAASNRGIDEIRSLRERIGLAPAEGQFVVYIIDEVHMLTTEAFNALLKTLEEPPEHAIFALCTTEYHKLPETVVSRCTQVIYPKATTEEVKNSLMKAVKGESLTISDTALTMLAESVDGSFRDGMKMLEQLAAAGTTIEDEAVELLVHRTTQYNTKPLIEALLIKDVKQALTIVGEAEAMGVDYGAYAKRLLDELRKRMLVGVERSDPQLSQVVGLIQKMAKACLETKTAYLPQLPLEAAIVEWCLGQVGETSVSAAPTQRVVARPAVGQTQSKPAESDTIEPVATASTPAKQTAKIPEPEPKVYEDGVVAITAIEQRWGDILAAVKPLNHSLEALLRSCRPKNVVGSEVTIEVFYKFHKDRLEEERHRSAIEKVMSDLFKVKIRLLFALGEGKTQPRPVKSQSAAPANDAELMKAAEEIFA